ncbi:DNA cytosine methyltransferase, partial [Rhizobium ecuadorense]
DTKHASYLARICADLSSLGYRVDVVTVDASDFGLPQDRTRIVIVGLRNDVEGLFIPPRPAPPLQGYVSDVLG